MATIVLVHGSWHDGTAWDATKKHLESAGHKVFAPTVAGYGKSADKKVNHAQCLKSIVDFILNRLGLYRLVQMPGSHEVMFTNPPGLAQKIVEAARD